MQFHKSGLFQLLLFSSVVSAVVVSFLLGFFAAALLSTFLCAAAFWSYSKQFGADWRSLFLCAVFYLLCWFFLAVKFFSGVFSLSILPFVAALVLAVIAVFRFAVYNKYGTGKVVDQTAGYVLVDIETSPWHSMSGVNVVSGSGGFTTGEQVLVSFSGGLVSPLKGCRVVSRKGRG